MAGVCVCPLRYMAAVGWHSLSVNIQCVIVHSTLWLHFYAKCYIVVVCSESFTSDILHYIRKEEQK